MISATYLSAGRYRYRGYTISRGDYIGTTDNSIDGWYVDPIESDTLDRRGPGYLTIRAAEETINRGGER